MQWNNTILSDNTSIKVDSVAIGNGYWVGAFVALSAGVYTIEILYSQDGSGIWRQKQIKTTQALKPTIGDIIFTGDEFAISYTILNSNKVSILHAEDPSGNWENTDSIYAAQGEIDINETAVLNGKICIAGAVTVDNITSGLLLVGDSITGEFENKVNLVGSRLERYSVFATVYTGQEYCAFVTRRTNLATNDYQIYSSADLEIWSEPVTVATDSLSAPPFPAFAYCTDYSALALFLHGQIYISKAGQRFITIPYPGEIGAESIRAVTSDGTKFLASSASANQSNLQVIYSSGDPTVAENWRVQTLAEGQQISSDVKFAASSSLFVVVSGGVNTPPTLYTALFPANELKIMKDRVPTYPGRVSLTSLGNNLYDLARADEPTEIGTKLSKVNLLSDDAALAVWNNTPPDVLCTPSTALEHLGNNAFHVGDILTTARDLSGDENWLECTGGDISFEEYPELYPLLPTGSIEDDWNTNVIGSDTMSSTSDCGVATDGEWYVMVVTNQETHNWYAYYTNNPANEWTKKTIAAATGKNLSGSHVHLIHAKGYFSFLAKDGQGNSFVVYTDDPSGEWQTKQIGNAGWTFDQFKYVHNTYIATATYSSGNRYNTVALTFDVIGGAITANTLISNQTAPVYTYDIDYYDGKWYAIWYQIVTNSSDNSYIADTRLYYADALVRVYSAGQFATVEHTSGVVTNYNYFLPQNLTCDHGYYVLWGYNIQTNNVDRFEMYYSNDLYTFTKSSKPDYFGLPSQASVPIFFGGTFSIALCGVSDSKPYILYGEDPANLTAKLLFDDVISRARLTASDASRTVFVGTQSNDYNTFTAVWQKAGKSLPKLTLGEGLNAYIKAKEGD